MTSQITRLLKKGVKIPNPSSVEIGNEVDPDRISGGQVIIHSGCKIFGKNTLILAGTQLGYEGPVTVNDCQIGPNVQLKGGFFEKAVFLGENQMGSGAHIRVGTILEEQANVAHTVALKQTILFPFVTLGSLINFCDCFMAGGTSRKDHSEVGSSYIHFNYTPNQDKATPSMLGDVPRGVMLDRPPIFLGGQGGLVGPCRIDFGNIIAAGSIFRNDVTDSGHLLIGSSSRGGRLPFRKGIYPNVKRIMLNNFIYFANLVALMQWYRYVRSLFVSNVFPTPLFEGLVGKLTIAIEERILRMDHFISLLTASLEKYPRMHSSEERPANVRHHQDLTTHQGAIIETLNRIHRRSVKGDETIRDRFIESLLLLDEKTGKDYTRTIGMLDASAKEEGARWLGGIVGQVVQELLSKIPSMEINSGKNQS